MNIKTVVCLSFIFKSIHLLCQKVLLMRYNLVRINVVARLARVTNQNIALARRQRVQATHSNPTATCVVQQHLLVINKKLARNFIIIMIFYIFIFLKFNLYFFFFE